MPRPLPSPPPRPRRVPGTLVVLVLVLAVGGLTAGCSAFAGDEATDLSAAVVQVPPDERGDPVEMAGDTVDGERVDLADLRGEVVVMPVWGSWCGPCRTEAPLLQSASEELDASFVGLSFRESDFANARAFEREFGITYPTIADDGSRLLDLGRWAPRQPPSTLVLDREGRVAALINGAIPSATTLDDIVTEVADEDTDAGTDGGGA